MIKANELRIGNLLAEVDGSIVEVAGINKDDTIVIYDGRDIHGSYPTSIFRPIPLNEVWLLKLGFEKKNEYDFDLGKLRICMYDDRFPKGRVYFNSWAIIDENLKYVHQLQNLYFALTNQELEIKEI